MLAVFVGWAGEAGNLTQESESPHMIKQGDSLVISGSTDCTLKIWSLETGKNTL
jgi:hypothetical protein